MIFLRFSQFITWPIAFIYFRLLYKIKVKGRNNLKNIKSPFIIIANHFSFHDSFLFRLVLGLWTPHLPLRFMAVNRFDWPWLNFLSKLGIVSLVYKIFGAFLVVPGMGIDKNLGVAEKLLLKGQNIVIYPEGKIVTKNQIESFKNGAATLSLRNKIPILPVTFRVIKNDFVRDDLIINIGKIVNVNESLKVEEFNYSLFINMVNLHQEI